MTSVDYLILSWELAHPDAFHLLVLALLLCGGYITYRFHLAMQ